MFYLHKKQKIISLEVFFKMRYRTSATYNILSTSLFFGFFVIVIVSVITTFVFQHNGFVSTDMVVSSIDEMVLLNVNVTNPTTIDTNTSLSSGLSVTVLDPVTTFNVTVLNSISVVSIDNFPPAISVNVSVPTQVDVTILSDLNVTLVNPITSLTVDNLPSLLNVTIIDPENLINVTLYSSSISINNFPTDLNVIMADSTATVSNVVDVTITNQNAVFTVNNFPSVQNVTVTNPVTNVTGTLETDSLTVENFPSNQEVTVTNGPVLNSQDQLLTSVVNPSTAYENILTDSLQPIFQMSPIYGIDTLQIQEEEVGTGEITVSDSSFLVNSGSTASSYSILQSKTRIKNKAGQGSRCVFSAAFTDSVVNNTQYAGLGNSEDGVFFGYNALEEFGILYQERGQMEVRLLTLYGDPTDSFDMYTATIVLDGEPFMVSYTTDGTSVPSTLGASGRLLKLTYTICRALFPTWKLQPVGYTIYFVSTVPGPRTGTYSYSASDGGSSGAITSVQVGSYPTEVFVAQQQWNGYSVPLTPSLFNVFAISLQNMDSGGIRFFVGVNQPVQFVNVHTIQTTNNRTRSAFGNPSFPFMAISKNTGSASSSIIKISSFSGFVEGSEYYTGNTISISRLLGTGSTDATGTNAQASNDINVFTIQNPLYFKNKVSQRVIRFVSLSVSSSVLDGSGYPNSVRFRLYKTRNNRIPEFLFWPPIYPPGCIFPCYNPLLDDPINMQPLSADTDGILISTSNIWYYRNFVYDQLWSGSVNVYKSQLNVFASAFKQELTLQPGEYLSLVIMCPTLDSIAYGGTMDIVFNID